MCVPSKNASYISSLSHPIMMTSKFDKIAFEMLKGFSATKNRAARTQRKLQNTLKFIPREKNESSARFGFQVT